MRTSKWSWLAVIAVGCGPQVASEDVEEAGEDGGTVQVGSDTDDASSGGESTSTPTTSAPTTTTTTTTTTMPEGSTSGGEPGGETDADGPGVGEFEALVIGDPLDVDSNVFAFSRCGPQSELQESGSLFELASSPDGRRFGITGHELVELVGGSEEPVASPGGSVVEDISWPVGAAWDSTRERVVLATLGGEGFMYTYAPQTQQWEQLSSLEDRDFHALTYRADLDVMYAVGRAVALDEMLFELSPDGLVLDETPLWGLPNLDSPGRGEALQLRWHEDELLIIVAIEGEMQMYSADPETGAVVPIDCG